MLCILNELNSNSFAQNGTCPLVTTVQCEVWSKFIFLLSTGDYIRIKRAWLMSAKIGPAVAGLPDHVTPMLLHVNKQDDLLPFLFPLLPCTQ